MCRLAIVVAAFVICYPARDLAGEDTWPRVYLSDPLTATVARHALDEAARLFQEPRCQAILTEFHDSQGRPVGDKLARLGVDARPVAAGPEECEAQLPTQIRIVDCQVARALDDAVKRSARLRRLVDRIGELKGIVFVRLVPADARSGVAGGLSHQVVPAGPSRILHVMLVRDYAYGDRVATTLAHEFQHVLEVLEQPSAQSEAEIDRLFDAIGHRSGKGAVETDAALEIAKIVAGELKRSRAAKRRT